MAATLDTDTIDSMTVAEVRRWVRRLNRYESERPTTYRQLVILRLYNRLAVLGG